MDHTQTVQSIRGNPSEREIEREGERECVVVVVVQTAAEGPRSVPPPPPHNRRSNSFSGFIMRFVRHCLQCSQMQYHKSHYWISFSKELTLFVESEAPVWRGGWWGEGVLQRYHKGRRGIVLYIVRSK